MSEENQTTSSLAFGDDAQANAVMLIQRQMFHMQSLQMQSLLTQHMDNGSSSSSGSNWIVPSILSKRNLAEELKTQKRLIDDTEMTLLGTLDSQGQLSLASRVSDFIVIMTRVVKIEHRALCLHILLNCMPLIPVAKSFISHGGLRLLKRWMIEAADNERIDELCVIVRLLKALPFDLKAVKDIEIGKSIKKLRKLTSEDATTLAKINKSLYKEVDSLMELWKVAAAEAAKAIPIDVSSSSNGTKQHPAIVVALNTKLTDKRGEPIVAAATVSRQQQAVPSAVAKDTVASNIIRDVAVTDKTGGSIPLSKGVDLAISTPSVQPTTTTTSTTTTTTTTTKAPTIVPAGGVLAALANKKIAVAAEEKQLLGNKPIVDVNGHHDTTITAKPSPLPITNVDVRVLSSSHALSTTSMNMDNSECVEMTIDGDGTENEFSDNTNKESVPAAHVRTPFALAPGPTPSSSSSISVGMGLGSGGLHMGGLGVGLGGLGAGQGLGGLGLPVNLRPTSAPANKRAEGVKLMAEKAKMLLQSAAAKSMTSSSSGGIVSNGGTLGTSSVLTALSKPSVPIVPLKGGLKRKHILTVGEDNTPLVETTPGSGSLPGAPKRAKLSVKWMDMDGGGSLKEELVFEVERIKKTINDYKSHRDLVRKEKQLEKDLHQRKGNEEEAMLKTMDWHRPETLKLSIDITDALNAPIISKERETQIRRLSNTLETRYVDDTLIPNDPDELPDALLKAEYEEEDDIPICANISWGDAARQQPMMEQSSLLSGAGETGSSLMSYDNTMYNPSPAIDEFSQIIAQLPPALRNIEPQLLQILVQDEGHIAFILNPMTGEVDPSKLDILRHQLLGSSSNSMNHQAYSSSSMGGGGGMYNQHRTSSSSSSSSNMYNSTTNGGGSMRGGSVSGQGLASSDRYGGNASMGFDRAGSSSGRDHENTWDMGHRDRSDTNRGGGDNTNHRGEYRLNERERANEREQREREIREQRDRDSLSQKDGRLAPGHGSKASTPCKFFNTRAGCRFGDVCPFGHFKSDDSGSSGGGSSCTYGPSSRGGPAVRGRGSGRR